MTLPELIAKAKNTHGYENLKEVLGKELGSLIYAIIDASDKNNENFNITINPIPPSITPIKRQIIEIKIGQIKMIRRSQYGVIPIPDYKLTELVRLSQKSYLYNKLLNLQLPDKELITFDNIAKFIEYYFLITAVNTIDNFIEITSNTPVYKWIVSTNIISEYFQIPIPKIIKILKAAENQGKIKANRSGDIIYWYVDIQYFITDPNDINYLILSQWN